jgi:hypothetical protein
MTGHSSESTPRPVSVVLTSFSIGQTAQDNTRTPGLA